MPSMYRAVQLWTQAAMFFPTHQSVIFGGPIRLWSFHPLYSSLSTEKSKSCLCRIFSDRERGVSVTHKPFLLSTTSGPWTGYILFTPLLILAFHATLNYFAYELLHSQTSMLLSNRNNPIQTFFPLTFILTSARKQELINPGWSFMLSVFGIKYQSGTWTTACFPGWCSLFSRKEEFFTIKTC